MTSAVASGVVDMSGVVSSILRSYLSVLGQLQQTVTGDPGALSTAAGTHNTQAGSLDAVSGTLCQKSSSLATDWEGLAFDAFSSASNQLTAEIDTVAGQLRQEAEKLSSAASALTTAKSAMDNVISQFTQAAQQLIQESATASAGAVNAFISAAQQLGESAVNAATTIAEQLGQALASIFGLTPEATEAKSGEGSEKGEKGEKGEAGGEENKAGHEEDEQKRAVQKWLTGQPWFRDWYKQTYGREPDAEHLKFGALDWFDKNDVLDGRRRSTSSPSAFYNSGWYKLNSDGLSSTSAPLKQDTPFGSLADPGEDGTFTQKLVHDSNVTLWDSGTSKLYDGSVYDPSTSGKLDMGGYGTLAGKSEFDVGPRVTDSGNLSIHSGQLQATGDLRGTLVDANASGSYSDGPVDLKGSADAFVGGDLAGHLSGGVNGVEAHVNAFAGAQVQGQASADVAGVGVGVNGSLQAGIGAQFDGQATWNNGDIKLNFKAGAALGLGASVGGNLDINLPKMAETAEEYGGEAVKAMSGAASYVGNTATQAASSVGTMWHNVGTYTGGW